MKITRKHLRNIIKEELSRLFEQEAPVSEDDHDVWVHPEIEIIGSPDTDPAVLDLVDRLSDASNELEFGYSDPLDSLASQVLAGTMDLETANDAAMTAFDVLARLDNAATIGVEAAVEAFGL